MSLSPEFFKINFHFFDTCNITPRVASLFSRYPVIVLYTWHFETVFESDYSEKLLNVLPQKLLNVQTLLTKNLYNVDRFCNVFVCAHLFYLFYHISFTYLGHWDLLSHHFLDSNLPC